MTTPINSFQDILDALERDPALRDALRRHILTEDILALPAQLKALTDAVEALVIEFKWLRADHEELKAEVGELRAGQEELRAGQQELKAEVGELRAGQQELKAEVGELRAGQEELKAEVGELRAGQEELKAEVGELRAGQQELKAEVGELRTGQDQLRTDVADLRAGQQELRTTVGRMGGDVSRLLGINYEGKATTFAPRMARRILGLTNPTVVAMGWANNMALPLPEADQAAERGDITWDEADDIVRADVIVSATSQEGTPVYVLAEISITVQEKDRDRARRRAALLEKATGVTTIPAVIGISEEAPESDSGIVFFQFDPDA